MLRMLRTNPLLWIWKLIRLFVIMVGLINLKVLNRVDTETTMRSKGTRKLY